MKEKCKFCNEREASGWYHGKPICKRCWRLIKGGYKFK